MDIINEFDKMLSGVDHDLSPADHEAGRELGLQQGRKLALTYVKHRQAADLEMGTLVAQYRSENEALRNTIDVAREVLSREVLRLTMPRNFEDLTSIVMKVSEKYHELEREAREDF